MPFRDLFMFLLGRNIRIKIRTTGGGICAPVISSRRLQRI